MNRNHAGTKCIKLLRDLTLWCMLFFADVPQYVLRCEWPILDVLQHQRQIKIGKKAFAHWNIISSFMHIHLYNSSSVRGSYILPSVHVLAQLARRDHSITKKTFHKRIILT